MGEEKVLVSLYIFYDLFILLGAVIMATTTKQTSSNFDFDAYNSIMTSANSGLKLYLAERLLQDVQEVMVRFKSPLRKDIDSIVDEVGQLRSDNKKYLASRQNSGNTEAIDNPVGSATHSTSADGGRVSGVQNLPDAPL